MGGLVKIEGKTTSPQKPIFEGLVFIFVLQKGMRVRKDLQKLNSRKITYLVSKILFIISTVT